MPNCTAASSSFSTLASSRSSGAGIFAQQSAVNRRTCGAERIGRTPGTMETVRMGPPIRHSLGWIAAEGDQVLDSPVFEFFENRSSLIFGLAHDREMTHDLETAFAVNPIDEVNGFFARASARPVRNRAEG